MLSDTHDHGKHVLYVCLALMRVQGSIDKPLDMWRDRVCVCVCVCPLAG